MAVGVGPNPWNALCPYLDHNEQICGETDISYRAEFEKNKVIILENLENSIFSKKLGALSF